MSLPKVIVGGFPNSGTSFLCHLIHEMGLSAGPPEFLKRADEHNRWGYWECLPLRLLVWGQLPAGFRVEYPENVPLFPLRGISAVRELVFGFAETHGIEVYKDNMLPIVYRLFPAGAKYVLITRPARDCYESPVRGGVAPYSVSYDDFETAVCRYWHLSARWLELERQALRIAYTDFKINFRLSVAKVADFIGVPLEEDDYGRLQQVFHPRTSISKSQESS